MFLTSAKDIGEWLALYARWFVLKSRAADVHWLGYLVGPIVTQDEVV